MRKKGANIGVCVLAVTVAWLFAGTAWVRAEDKAEAQEIVDKAKVTFGLQIGGEAAETLILVMTQKAVDSLYTSSVKLGGDTSIALGPVGFGAKSNVTADFLAFSESKGIYGGINLEGSVLGVRDSLNKIYYGEEVSPVQIIVEKIGAKRGICFASCRLEGGGEVARHRPQVDGKAEAFSIRCV